MLLSSSYPDVTPPARSLSAYRALIGAALVAPPLAVAAILVHTFQALPLLDDYNASLGFLLRQQALHGFIAKLSGVLADQQFQYKFLLFHGAILAQRALTGHLSFVTLTIVGNLLFLPLLYCLAANAFPNLARQKRLPLLIPVLCFSCQLTFAEVFNWALASFNCLAVVSFVALSLHFLVRAAQPGRRWSPLLFASLSLVVACAASTNGLLLAPFGAAILLRTKRLSAAFFWCCTAVGCLALYLYRLEPVHQPIGPLVTQALFVPSFAGGAVENMHRRPVPGAAILLGSLLLLAFCDAVRTKYHRRNPFFFSLAAWTISTAIVVARYRSVLGVSQSLSGRYKLYSVVLIVFAYVYIAERILDSRFLSGALRQRLYAGALAASVTLSIAGDITGAAFLARRKQWVALGMQQYQSDPVHLSPLPTLDPIYAPEVTAEHDLLSSAIANGLWNPPIPQARSSSAKN